MIKLKLLGYFTSLFLIFIICWRLPQKDVGLASFTNSSDIFGSPSSVEKTANIVTWLAIFAYFIIAIQFNLQNNY
jgi:preprotein translocase subunit SecG